MTVRTVVTGLGVLAPNGVGLDEYWAAVLSGRSGLGRVERFDPSGYPSQVAGEIKGFEAAEHLPAKLLPQTDRVTQLSLTAADWAIADAGIDPAGLPEYGAGVVTASSSGGFEFGQRELEALWARGPKYVSAYQSFAWFCAVNTGQISIRHGLRGPSGAVVSDQAGGLDAVAGARRAVRQGTGLMVTGGVDSSLCPWAWIAHLAGGGISTRRAPERAYLPFDHEADGYVPGEGGAILVVEDAAHAAARGAARVYGEVAGYASGFDPRPGSGRPPALRRVIGAALADAGLEPGDVDVVFADAAGLPDADAAEAAALAGVFGERGVPVTAPKTMTGRLYAGGAPLDLAAALLSIRDGVIPPTVHVGRPVDEYGLDLVLGEPRAAEVRTALVLSRGRGGHTSAMCLTAA
ncbi:ketosynthase chain-length factor [Kitasatospora sp. NPDC056446]|uniref:ketosynthase chain-length factor n=1 Tax=Kitasatospora sp. NPDC056446 TaxID=3345819 RepID=UPI003689354D